MAPFSDFVQNCHKLLKLGLVEAKFQSLKLFLFKNNDSMKTMSDYTSLKRMINMEILHRIKRENLLTFRTFVFFYSNEG